MRLLLLVIIICISSVLFAQEVDSSLYLSYKVSFEKSNSVVATKSQQLNDLIIQAQNLIKQRQDELNVLIGERKAYLTLMNNELKKINKLVGIKEDESKVK